MSIWLKKEGHIQTVVTSHGGFKTNWGAIFCLAMTCTEGLWHKQEMVTDCYCYSKVKISFTG